MTDERDGPDPDDVLGGVPDDAAVRHAVAATRAELAALPTPEPPPEVVARWTAALAAEAAQGTGASRTRGDVRGRVRGRRRPQRRLLAAAAAVVVAVGLGVLVFRPEPAGPTVTRVELVAAARDALGTMDVADLADPGRRAACLRAVAPDAAGEPLLGGRRVVLDGRPALLLVLATGTRGGLRIVTVDPGCGPEGGVLRAQIVVG